MPHIHANGIQLYYERGGAGEPVIFIHGGLPCLAMAMRDLKPYDWGWENDFAEYFDFVWYDRRGCYRSSRPQSDYSIATQADDLTRLLDHLGLPSAHIVASSAGGPVAMRLAATYPSRVRSLVLTGTAINLFPDDDEATQIIKEQIRILDASGAEMAFAKRPEGVEVTLEVLWGLAEARERGDLEAFLAKQQALTAQAERIPHAERVAWYAAELNAIRAYIAFDLATERITQPTLILHGQNDQSVPLAWAEATHSRLPNSTLDIVEPGSHSLLFRDAAARSRAIQFIEDNTRQV